MKRRQFISKLTVPVIAMPMLSAMILDGKQAIIPLDGLEGWKDMVVVEVIDAAVKTSQKQMLRW
ncbi:MAG: hypothetical protein ACOVOS_08860 [Chitinophagaceae bacterium]|jgi:hypothetical protein